MNAQHRHFLLAPGPLLHYILDTEEVKAEHHPSVLMGLQPQWGVAAKMVLSVDW